MTQWHRLTIMPGAGPIAETVAQAVAQADSPWFDGHFPEMPVLPGIAQLAMVKAVIAGVVGPAVRVAQIRRIRFKRKIGPGERLTVAVTAQAAVGVFAFRILAEDAVACIGFMTVAVDDAD